MRIAILGSRGYPSTYGGFETFVRRIAPYLAELGHEVLVYGREGGGLHRPNPVGAITTIRTAGIDSKRLSTVTFGGTSAVDVSVRSADVVLAMNVALGYFLPCLRLAAIPTLLNVDGLEWERGKWGAFAKNVFRGGAFASARFATRLVADSQAVGKIWSERFGVRPTYIPYGADIVDGRPTDRLRVIGIEPGSYVLVVARLVPENHVDLTLDALELLGEARPPLVVVGSAGFPSPLEGRLAALSETRSVTWLGHVSDQELLVDLWYHAGVYVHGHSVGGTNPALLQALGAGAPTLAYPSPFNREVVGNESGLTYHVSPRELARQIQGVLGSPELRARMSEEGRQRVRVAYRWEDVCAAYANNLVEIAEG